MKKTHGVIYALHDPNTDEVRYVGKTVQTPSRRLYWHIRKARVDRSPVYLSCWIRSLPADPYITVLEGPLLVENLNEAERRWIAKLRTEGARLTNLTDGGGGGDTSRHLTPEGRKRQEEARARRWSDPQQRELQADVARKTHIGTTRSNETKAKMKAAALRVGADPEVRRRRSMSAQERWARERVK